MKLEQVEWFEGENLLMSDKQLRGFSREQWTTMFHNSFPDSKITRFHPLLAIVQGITPSPLLFTVMGEVVLCHDKDTNEVTYFKVAS